MAVHSNHSVQQRIPLPLLFGGPSPFQRRRYLGVALPSCPRQRSRTTLILQVQPRPRPVALC